MTRDAAPRLAIVGDGLTGAALAARALGAARGPIRIEVVEPEAALGRGAAYATEDPAHRINVPSHRMSLFPEDPDHFTRWLHARGVLPDARSTDPKGDHYVPRAAFGLYAAGAVHQRSAPRSAESVSRKRPATNAPGILGDVPHGLARYGAAAPFAGLSESGRSTPLA